MREEEKDLEDRTRELQLENTVRCGSRKRSPWNRASN